MEEKEKRSDFSMLQNCFIRRMNDLSFKALKFYLYLNEGIVGSRYEGNQPDNRVWHSNKTILKRCPFFRTNYQIGEAIHELDALGWLSHFIEYPPVTDPRTLQIIPDKFHKNKCHMFRLTFSGFLSDTDYQTALDKVQDDRDSKSSEIELRVAKSKAAKEAEKEERLRWEKEYGKGVG
jgi:hypothetical protein